MKLILINAPPYAGKDTAALALRRYHEVTWAVYLERMSFPIKRAFAGFMNTSIDRDGNVERYGRRKEDPIDILSGCSYRQWQIQFSENFVKPNFYPGIFSRLLWERIEHLATNKTTLVVVPDCGFQIEIDTLLGRLLTQDLMLLQIERPGATFDGDSREWVGVPDTITRLRLLNDRSAAEFEDLVIRSTKDWIAR